MDDKRLKSYLKAFLEEYGNQMIQIYGLGSEKLPEWADDFLDELMRQAEEIQEVGYAYYREGEEVATLLFVPKFKVWIIHTRSGTPGNEIEHVGVFDSYKRVRREYIRIISDMIQDVREQIQALKESGAPRELIKDELEWYRDQLRELRTALRRVKEYL